MMLGVNVVDKLRLYHGLNSGVLCIYKHANIEQILRFFCLGIVNSISFGIMYSAIQDIYMMYYENIPKCIRVFKSNNELILPSHSRDLKVKHIMNYGSFGGLIYGAYLSFMSMSIFRMSVKGKTIHII